MKCGSFVPRVNNPHVATSSKRQINSISETTLWIADRRCGPGRGSSEVRNFFKVCTGGKKMPSAQRHVRSGVNSGEEQQWNAIGALCLFICIPFFPSLMSSQVERNTVMSAPLKAQPIAYSEFRDVRSRKNLWAAPFSLLLTTCTSVLLEVKAVPWVLKQNEIQEVR